MYIEVDVEKSYRLMTGGPVIMIASQSKDGVADVMSCAWNCPFAYDEMMPVLDLGHTTTANILDTGKLTICIPSVEQGRTILAVGNYHGRECGDKFVKTNTPFDTGSNGIKVPTGCLAYLECDLLNHDLLKQTGICLCKVKRATVQEKYWDKENEHFGEGMKLIPHHVTGSLLISGGEIKSYSRRGD